MRSLRKKIARMVITVVTLAVVYILTQMGDPDYVPAPGWLIVTTAGGLSTWWASQYCEFPGFPRQ